MKDMTNDWTETAMRLLDDEQQRRAEGERFLGLLHGEDHWFELRCLNKGRGAVSTLCRGATPGTERALAIERMDRPSGCYVTLNPVQSEHTPPEGQLIAENTSGSATNDTMIERLRWLLIDLDPKRPTSTSSTDQEVQKALNLGGQIRSDLTERGWPEPIMLLSGNGCHLLYPIDLEPADSEIVKQTLYALAHHYSNGEVDVDRSVHNPSRITKLPGTFSRKGESTPERPHRVACILSAPEERPQAISRDQLRMLAIDWGELAHTAGARPSPAAHPQRTLNKRAHRNISMPQFEPIMDHCAFVKHAVEDAETLSEPEWHAVISTAAQCDQGETISHAISEPHPGYNHAETQKKYEQAARKNMPVTCQHINQTLGFEGCEGCQFKDRIKSPIQIGRFNLPEDAQGIRVINPSQPMETARQFINAEHHHDDHRTLIHLDGDYYAYGDGVWTRREDEIIRKSLYNFLEQSFDDDYSQIIPRQRMVSEIDDALQSAVVIPHRDEETGWLIDESDPLPRREHILVCANGLLDIANRTLVPHTPAFFARNRTDVVYDPDAPEPTRWMELLREQFEGDQQSIDLLQEWFGYCLGSETHRQKMLLLIGPPRSGKSTMMKMLTALVGSDAVANPTLASFKQNFGMQDLIGKKVAVVGDLRMSSDHEHCNALERLLSITGEDSIMIDRKYRDPISLRLSTRITILSNELPMFRDNAGAFGARLLILQTRISHTGKEDYTLEDTLKRELSGILNWALDGYARLRGRGRFVEPDESQSLRSTLEEVQSDLQIFVADMGLRIGPGEWIFKDELYRQYMAWCQRNNMPAGSKIDFGRRLVATFTGIKTKNQKETDPLTKRKCNVYRGIGVSHMPLAGEQPVVNEQAA